MREWSVSQCGTHPIRPELVESGITEYRWMLQGNLIVNTLMAVNDEVLWHVIICRQTMVWCVNLFKQRAHKDYTIQGFSMFSQVKSIFFRDAIDSEWNILKILHPHNYYFLFRFFQLSRSFSELFIFANEDPQKINSGKLASLIFTGQKSHYFYIN